MHTASLIKTGHVSRIGTQEAHKDFRQDVFEWGDLEHLEEGYMKMNFTRGFYSCWYA